MTTERQRKIREANVRVVFDALFDDRSKLIAESRKTITEADVSSALGRLRQSWPRPKADEPVAHALQGMEDRWPPVEFLAYCTLLGVPPPLEIVLAVSHQVAFYLAAEGSLSLDEAMLGAEGRSVQRAGNYAKRQAAERKKSIVKSAAASLEKQDAKASKLSVIQMLLNDPTLAHLLEGVGEDAVEKWLPSRRAKARI